jgi:monoamine oxidase
MVTLKTIRFSPGLPEPLCNAVAEAGSSGNTQFYLTTDHPFWEEDGYGPSMWTDTIFERLFVEFLPDGSVDHLRIWINGDNAGRVDALGDGAEAELLETLARLRPSTRGHLDVFHRVSWGGEPLIGGEKYVMGPGQVTRFAGAIAQPVGPIHWAGEHHKSLEVGIEAALQSGERAAREILAEIRQPA